MMAAQATAQMQRTQRKAMRQRERRGSVRAINVKEVVAAAESAMSTTTDKLASDVASVGRTASDSVDRLACDVVAAGSAMSVTADLLTSGLMSATSPEMARGPTKLRERKLSIDEMLRAGTQAPLVPPHSVDRLQPGEATTVSVEVEAAPAATPHGRWRRRFRATAAPPDDDLRAHRADAAAATARLRARSTEQQHVTVVVDSVPGPTTHRRRSGAGGPDMTGVRSIARI